MQPIFRSATPGSKIATLFILLFTGLIVSLLIMGLMNMVFGMDDASNATSIYTGSVLQSLFAIALPAYLTVALTTDSSTRYLKLGWDEKMGWKVIFAVLLFVFSYPFVSFLTQWNSGMQLPEWMSSLEEVMRSMEDAAMETTKLLLSGRTPAMLILNLIVVAGLAAFSEELFFRGALQQFLCERFRNGHVAVWLSALLFSLVHFQFYGFLPRMMLGVLLGYLFLYTRNLWVAVIFHFVNNATVILLYFFWSDKEWFSRMEELSVTIPFLVVATVSVLLTLLLFWIYLKRDRQSVDGAETINLY